MRRYIVLVIGLFVFASGIEARAQGFGIGAIVGEPTGLSVKKWLSEDRAIDAAAAWSFSENDSFQFHADYLFHDLGILDTQTAETVSVYAGLGGRVKLNDDEGRGRNVDDDLVGVRVPIGLSYMTGDKRIEAFGEIVPVLDVAPDSDFDINAAIGARVYLH